MTNIRSLIDSNPISITQFGVIAMCVLMNMLDGMDVMVITYSQAGVRGDLSIPAVQMGFVFSAALIGMAFGGLFIAPIADIIGRRKVMLGAILVMGVGVSITAYVETFQQLVSLRFLSGLGIGAMLASTVTLASEYAPERQRNLVLGVVLAGYPIGATVSGFVAAQIIPAHGWRAMFTFAGFCTLFSLPIAIFLLKESWEWLIKRQPKYALKRVNSIAVSMNYQVLNKLPPATAAGEKAPVSEMLAGLLGSKRRGTTIKLWSAFFLGFATLYYLTTWIPGLAERTGMSTTMAIYAGTVFNLGAIFGNTSQGYSSQKVGLRSSIIGFYVFTAALMAVFGFVSGDWTTLMVFGLIGFGGQGGLVGLYTIAARVYPAEIRNTGVGWAIGLGRVGAIISPVIGGVLAAKGMPANVIMLFFAVPLVIACFAVWLIKSAEIN